jgi:hypothetical protein
MNKKKNLDKIQIFISHATGDHPLARELVELLCECFRIPSEKIFYDQYSLLPGKKLDDQIKAALAQAEMVIVLMTPRSVFSPWVLFEMGRGHFSVRKRLVVLLANGLPHERLPAPAFPWFAVSLEAPEGVEMLVRAIAQDRGVKMPKLDEKRVSTITALALGSLGDWMSVNAALVADEAATSPFGFENILTRNSPYEAKKSIVLVSQTFYTFTSQQERFKEKVFKWLENGESRTFSILLMDIKAKNCLVGWKKLFREPFERHLQHSTDVFREWRELAQSRNLSFKFKVTDIVPSTLLFVDPPSASGYLILTPITFHIHGPKRPHFILRASTNRAVYSYYWSACDEQLSNHSRDG